MVHFSPGEWVGFGAGVLALLALDLGVLHRGAQRPGLLAAAGWSAAWVGIGLAFGAALATGWVGAYEPAARGLASVDYLTAYLVELSLSLDNLFVFAMLFRVFGVAREHQHRVLFWGVVGALGLRLVMIVGGLTLLAWFEWMLYGFGALLLWSAWRLWGAADGGVAPANNPFLRLLRRIVPVSDHYDGARFFTMENGRRVATPLLAVLVAVETTDVLFAVDSVPAVLGVTRDPFLAYTSNVFAILGLRSLYFLLEGALDRFRLLHYALALMLGFIGLKMMLGHVYPIPNTVALAVVAVLVGGAIAGSLLARPKNAPRSAG
jgi:tellurite resistance protein TerC